MIDQLVFSSGLLDLDWAIFKWINSGISNELFDQVLPWVRNKMIWVPLYVFIISFIIFHWKKKSWLILFFLFLTVGASDFFSASIIKPLIQRERPCNDVLKADQVELRVYCGAGYSFPSSHATNHTAIAVFLFFLFAKILRKGRFLFLFWAILISFAQVYVGVHYPLDILGGFLLGILIAIGINYLLNFYMIYFFDKPFKTST